MIREFFINLAARFAYENDLSDITWALAKSNFMFLEIFMKLLKFEEFRTNEPTEIIREYQIENCRPDFLVRQGEKLFLIENKIGDRQHHFEQYARAFPGAAKALISAYKLNAEEKVLANQYGFSSITWRDLAETLRDKIERRLMPDDFGIVEAYVEYVREVCGIMELKKASLEDGFLCIHAFTKLAAWVLIEGFTKSGFKCAKYTVGRAFGECWAGQYAELIFPKSTITIYPWLGIEFNIEKKQSAIMVCIDKDWNDRVYDSFTELGYINDIFQYRKDKEEEFLEFKLNDNLYDTFFQDSMANQKQLLLDFFNIVVDEIANHLK